MAVLRIGLLQTDHVVPELAGIAGDYADMFDALIGTHAPELELVRYDAIGGRLPDDPAEADGWIVPGSRFSVYDDEPWIARLLAFIRDIHRSGEPAVGICFGHQALAHALGGEAARAAAGWGVGVHETVITDARSWMDPPAERLCLLMSHQDQVRTVPQGATVLGRAEHCPIAMFEVDDRFLGIQGHPEFVAPYAAALLDARRDRIPADVIAAAEPTFERQTDAPIAARWIARFLAERA